MQPIGVVIADPATDAGSCLAAALEGVEKDAFVFQRSPQPLDEDVKRPRPSIEMRMPASLSVVVKAKLVNWADSNGRRNTNHVHLQEPLVKRPPELTLFIAPRHRRPTG